MSAAATPGGRASLRLRRVMATIRDEDTVSIGVLVDRLGAASVGLVLLIVSLAAMIPIPGPIGQVFGASIALIGWQVLRGARRIYLPNRIRRATVRTSLVAKGIARFLPLLGWIEARTRTRRWLSLTRIPVQRALGAVVILLGAIVALPIPLGNIMPVVALLIVSVALLERDGGAVIAGLVTTVVACAWTVFLLMTGVNVFNAVWAWLGF
jgi:hypothetical protein